MDLLGLGLGVARWVVDQIWDLGARNFRAEFQPTTVSAGRSGDFCPELLVTLYNRGRPQMVERAHLLLSNGREFFLEPNGDFERLPVLVTETRNCVVAYSVDELRMRLADHYGRRRPKVAGIRLHLASGRKVSLRRRVDIFDRQLFPAAAAYS